MSKNVWLERAEKKKAATTAKFKGKFQEASKVNKQGRMYSSEAFAKLKDAVPDATIIVNCCTRTMIGHDPKLEKSVRDIAAENKRDEVAERWQAPTTDEDIWIPLRPATPEQIKINQDSVKEISAAGMNSNVKFRECDFIDLSAVKVDGSNSRYKEYDRLRKQTELMEDAMVVYHAGRSEPRDDQAALDAGDLGEDYPGEAQDIAYFKNKLFNAMKMPSKVAEEKTQKKMQKLHELKLQVMASNPMIMGVPAPEGFSSYVSANAGHYNQSYSFSGPTSIRFQPDQITHHVIGGERRAFSVDVKPENAEKFMKNLKAQFKKKKVKKPSEVELKAEFTKRAMEKMEALAAESETWFAPNGPNRGNIPGVIEVFADIAVDMYKTLTAKIDNMCNEVFMDTTVTMDPAMAENVLSMDKLPACETFTVTSGQPWNQPGVGQWSDGPVSMGC